MRLQNHFCHETYSHTYIPVSLFNLLPVPTIKWCPGCISTLRSYTDLQEEKGCHQQGWIFSHFKCVSFTETSHQWSVYKLNSVCSQQLILKWYNLLIILGFHSRGITVSYITWNFWGLNFFQQASYAIRTHWFGSMDSSWLDHGRKCALWIW